MMSGTSVRPPQLDEFFPALRADERRLSDGQETIWNDKG